jgi:hypothetical protein
MVPLACGGSDGDGAGGQSEPADGAANADPRDATSSPLDVDTTAAPGAASTPVPDPSDLAIAPLVAAAEPAEPGDVVDVVCVAQSAASELRRVYMAFAFDISASMGNNAETFSLKWQPVVAATKIFFVEPEAAGISASLTFFPGPGGTQAQCASTSYVAPDVPQTLLPSNAFAAAIDGLGMTPNDAWRTSTPTLAVYQGTVASLRALREGSSADANVTQAIVLVTDGLPQSCGANDDLERVLREVQASGILTYVVGVALEPNAAENLNRLAQAGGTESAFIIAIGDPLQTERDFKAAVDEIRGVSVSCTIAIPLPPINTEFVPEQVNVTYDSSGSIERLSYDPDCRSEAAWRYDDLANPQAIVLCDSACGAVQADVKASLEIEFGCRRRDVVR